MHQETLETPGSATSVFSASLSFLFFQSQLSEPATQHLLGNPVKSQAFKQLGLDLPTGREEVAWEFYAEDFSEVPGFSCNQKGLFAENCISPKAFVSSLSEPAFIFLMANLKITAKSIK